MFRVERRNENECSGELMCKVITLSGEMRKEGVKVIVFVRTNLGLFHCFTETSSGEVSIIVIVRSQRGHAHMYTTTRVMG